MLLVKRLKVLLSAYACEPGLGSEPGIGWNVARELAEHHEVWVITRTSNRDRIERELAREPVASLHFAYYDLPVWLRFWKRRGRGVQVYYYFWQLGIFSVARAMHRTVCFDVIQHVTLGRYWSPSLLSRLPVPFLWGPVGGGESAPSAFWSDFSWRGKQFELLRSAARWLGEHDPLVRMTAHRSSLTLATTEETRQRLTLLGACEVRVFPQVGLPSSELATLRTYEPGPADPVRFVSVGRLLHWKGVHLTLRAFAGAGLNGAELWIIGDGPERRNLEQLAARLGVEDNVRFLGGMPRPEVLTAIQNCHVLVHPSLHDSGGWVCLEAMAASRPVICLDLGGPGAMVTEDTGIKVPAVTPAQAVEGLTEAMRQLARDRGLRQRMGANARQAVTARYSWAKRAEALKTVLFQAAAPGEATDR